MHVCFFNWLISCVTASFRESGVDCVYDNKKVVQNCHVVFLACLPCQVQTVAEEVRHHIPTDCIIYSVVTAVSLPRWVYNVHSKLSHQRMSWFTLKIFHVYRLRQLFCHNNVVKTEFTWPTPSEDVSWPIGCNVVDSLKIERCAEATCPVNKVESSGK